MSFRISRAESGIKRKLTLIDTMCLVQGAWDGQKDPIGWDMAGGSGGRASVRY